MKKIIFLIALVISTSAIFGQDEELEVKGNVLYKDQVNSMKPPAPILNVPQSVSIITDEDILNQGFRALSDIVRYVPGVHSTQGEGHRDAIVIRGIRTTADFYLDGQRDDVQYYRSLYNVEQVEVLKGPNALLFGRGGTGGLINRVSKKAVLGETFTSLNLGYDSFTANDLAVDTNMQLNDTVAMRLMLHSDTLANHRDLYDGTRSGINPTFTFTLNEATELNISLEYLDHERFIDRGIPTTGALVNEALSEVVYGHPSKNLHTTEGTILKANLVHNYSDNGKINLSIMGNNFNKMYQNIYVKDVTNTTEGCETTTTITTVACMEGYRDTTARESSILNLVNVNTFDRGTLTVGIDLIDTDNENERFNSYFTNQAADTLGAAGAPLGASGLRNNFSLTNPGDFTVDAFGNGTLLDFTSDAKVKSETEKKVESIFITGDIDLADQWQMILGLRYEEVDTTITKYTPAAGVSPNYVALTPADTIQRVDSNTSPRLGLIFKPQENMSLYLSYSESFMPRTDDQYKKWDTTQADPNVFENTELGFKYNSDSGINLAVAYFDSETVQGQSDGAGGAEVIDFDMQGIELTVGGQINDANSIDFSLSSVDATDTNNNRDQKEIPELTYSLWYTHTANEMFSVSLGAVYQDEQWISSVGGNNPKLPDYTRVDMAMAITPTATDTIRINIENLLDEDYYPYSHSTHQVTVGESANLRLSYSKSF